MVYTKGPLHAALLGAVPIGAYIPFPGAKVQLGQTPSPFPEQPTTARLVDKYPSDIGNDWLAVGVAHGKFGHHDVAKADQGFPVVDLLGPNLVLWTDSRIRIPRTSFAKEPRSGAVTALVIRRSTFATRVAISPLSQFEYRYMIRHNAIRRLGDAYFGEFDHGKITLTLDHGLSARAYRDVRMKVRRNDLSTVRSWEDLIYTDDQGHSTHSKGWTREVDRYPPLPKNSGFNVFGPLTSLRLAGALGTLVVGDHNIPLSAPSEVDLTDVQALQDQTEGAIAIPLATAGSRAELSFEGVGKAAVNGVAETTFIQRRGGEITAFGSLAAVGGFVLAVLTLILNVAGTRTDPTTPTARTGKRRHGRS